MKALVGLLLILLVLIGLGFLWVLSGGPDRESAKEPYIRFSQISLPQAPGIPSASVRRATDDEGTDDTEDLLSTLPLGGPQSPHKGDIEILHNKRGAQEFAVQEEYIEIRASRRNASAIDISGWKLRSPVTKRTEEIPEVTPLYESGILYDRTPLLLAPGETAIIVTGRSPVGNSFKENVCTGYLEQFQNFSPKLDRKCPLPEDELPETLTNLITYGAECVEYVDTLPRCEMQLTPPPLNTKPECGTFIDENINYTGCVRLHKDDDDFFQDQWRVYLGLHRPLWNDRHDIVTLLDDEGRVVDSYSY